MTGKPAARMGDMTATAALELRSGPSFNDSFIRTKYANHKKGHSIERPTMSNIIPFPFETTASTA